MRPNKKKQKAARLQLKRTTVRVLSKREMRQVVGGRAPCCDADSELLNPYTGGGGYCCDLRTELLNPFTY